MSTSNTATIAELFREHAARWKAGRRQFTSKIDELVDQPDYRAIVALGVPAIPLILGELAERPDWWFAALRELTGANPVPAADRGSLERMARDWIEWGRLNGYAPDA